MEQALSKTQTGSVAVLRSEAKSNSKLFSCRSNDFFDCSPFGVIIALVPSNKILP